MVSTLTPATELNYVPVADSPVEVYEPTASDKIQRVLYRLDHGEQLSCGQLKQDNNFCVLGLFVDESGLGQWELQRNNTFRYIENIPKKRGLVSYLSADLAKYYGFNSTSGRFLIQSLPDPLRSDLLSMLNACELYSYTNRCSLAILNDELLDAGYSSEIVNNMLARIIRSGVIFKKQRTTKES